MNLRTPLVTLFVVGTAACGNPPNDRDATSDATGDASADAAVDASSNDVTADVDASCAPGTARTNDQCVACSAGQYCAGGDSPAAACAGTWDDDSDPSTMCVPYSTCPAGTWISVAGAATHDRTCQPCDAGSFSATPDAGQCIAWSTCAPGTAQDMPGSTTHDRTCRFAPAWLHQFGTSTIDWGRAIAADANGNTVIVGSSGQLPGQTQIGPFVRKYDAQGNELWTRALNLGTRGDINGVVIDATGNVYIAGVVGSALPGQTAIGMTDAFVRKYDAAGTEVWTRQFGTTQADGADAVAIDASGNVLVAGSTFGRFAGQTATGHLDPFVRKYDASGNAQWTTQWGAAGGETHGVATDAAGNVYVVGEINGSIPGATSLGGEDGFVRKLDASGMPLWTQQFGSRGYDFGDAVTVSANGTVYIAGHTDNAVAGTNAGHYDAIVMAFDTAGAMQWSRQFGSSEDDRALGIAIEPGGTLAIVGVAHAALPGQTAVAGADLFIARYAANGARSWVTQVGTTHDDTATSIATDGAGHLFIAGSTNGTWNGQVSAGDYDAFVARIDP